ncbi:D-alanine--D-alanine ligase family protein [Elusimicrobiota bacterium]
MSTKKLKIALIFGGKSAEHEISQRSALSVLGNLDPKKYEVYPVIIDRNGFWTGLDAKKLLENISDQKELPDMFSKMISQEKKKEAKSVIPMDKVALPVDRNISAKDMDVVFPVLHGPMGEDGTMQGFLEMAQVPYVGCDVFSSAACMDKDIALRLVKSAGIEVPGHVTIEQWQWKKDKNRLQDEAQKSLGYPMFVKPVKLGSSVGITKAKDKKSLGEACDLAFQYDDKIVLEEAIEAREIECAVLGDSEDMTVSVPGEVIPRHDFYSYEAKYIDPEGAILKIPAPIPKEKKEEVMELSRKCFLALNCCGMARIDFLMHAESQKIYFGEINTIPGFTSISMYPKLMEASGVPYPALIERLIELALKRASIKEKFCHEHKR